MFVIIPKLEPESIRLDEKWSCARKNVVEYEMSEEEELRLHQ
jgi:hypothetical protein